MHRYGNRKFELSANHDDHQALQHRKNAFWLIPFIDTNKKNCENIDRCVNLVNKGIKKQDLFIDPDNKNSDGAKSAYDYILKQKKKPLLDDERYLTDREVAQILKVSRRTLQEYRNDGVIPYVLFGGKVLYRESDLERVLESCYHPAYKR